jgi:hypothetical protein
MAKDKGIGARMQDFYFEITSPDGETRVIGDDPNTDRVEEQPSAEKSRTSEKKQRR